MNLSIANSLCYTIGWFWCVLFGIHRHPILAIAGALLLIIFQLYYTRSKDLFLYIQDLLLVLFSIPFGILLEMFFIQANIIHYLNMSYKLPPVWIICLYPLFSLLLNHSLKIVKKSYTAAFLLGVFGAPMSYMAGISLGGLTFPYPIIPTWIIIGICWGLFLCLMSKMGRIVEKAAAGTMKDRNSTIPLALLYDGECPLCNREICHLRKKETQNTMRFVDIASKGYTPRENGNIDYATAMSQIHAVDDQGNLLVGVSAFAAVYARCQLLVLSTLLRIPFIRSCVNPIYSLFAKKRLWITGRANTNFKK